MITRIVKLSFKQAYRAKFESDFPQTKKVVISNDGCHDVILLKSKEAGIYFTYSTWDSEVHLNKYRNSDTFKKIWSQFKINFDNKAEAWTTKEVL